MLLLSTIHSIFYFGKQIVSLMHVILKTPMENDDFVSSRLWTRMTRLASIGLPSIVVSFSFFLLTMCFDLLDVDYVITKFCFKLCFSVENSLFLTIFKQISKERERKKNQRKKKKRKPLTCKIDCSNKCRRPKKKRWPVKKRRFPCLSVKKKGYFPFF